jgi:hypothetical protein
MNCENVIKITSISNTGGSYFLVASSLPRLVNGGTYILVLPSSLIAASSTINQVYIAYNNKNYPLIDKCIGNNVYSDQLRFIDTNTCGNKVLRMKYGTSPIHFKVISQCLPQSSVTPNT